jgi:hypothetical protein
LKPQSQADTRLATRFIEIKTGAQQAPQRFEFFGHCHSWIFPAFGPQQYSGLG